MFSGQQPGKLRQQVPIGQFSAHGPLFLQHGGGAHGVEVGTEVAALLSIPQARALEARPRRIFVAVPHGKGSPEGTAGVAGGGLNPDLLERALPQQATVGHAVQGHTPC